jgi:hypothetical protein
MAAPRGHLNAHIVERNDAGKALDDMREADGDVHKTTVPLSCQLAADSYLRYASGTSVNPQSFS